MNRNTFKITDDNFYELIEVSKQVFWMYYDISSNEGIFHNTYFELVDYNKYIMCEIIEERLKTPNIERIVEIVNQGCFTALCCHVLNLMDEERRDKSVMELIESLLQEERINGMDFEKCLLNSMKNTLLLKPSVDLYWTNFADGEVFDENLKAVYSKYVRGFYQSLLKDNKR